MDPIGDDFYLDTFGQAPILHQIYIHMCLVFNVSDPASYPAILNRLRHGLSQLTKDLPWVAGHVVNEGAKPGNTGMFKIKSYKDTAPELIVRDLRQDPLAPTMSDLRAARFPFSMLKEEMLGPLDFLLTTVMDDYPVFLVQASIIDGGLLLTFLAEHAVVDGIGQGQLINLFAKGCRQEAFTSEEIAHGNLPRRNIIETLGEDIILESHLDSVTAGLNKNQDVDQERSENQAPHPSRHSWVNFAFSVESLAAIKSLAVSTMTADAKYVSTDDAVSAFIWQCLTRCTLSRMHEEGRMTSATTTTTFGRAISARRYLGVPEDYPGLLFNTKHRTHSAHQLAENATLGSIASKLRADVDPATSEFGLCTRAMATLLERSSDKSFYHPLINLDHALNINLSSWVKLTCHTKDFGPGLGQPEALRIPSFGPVGGLVILLPETAQNGSGIVTAMCLRSEDIEYLRRDVIWATYATYIG